MYPEPVRVVVVVSDCKLELSETLVTIFIGIFIGIFKGT